MLKGRKIKCKFLDNTQGKCEMFISVYKLKDRTEWNLTLVFFCGVFSKQNNGLSPSIFKLLIYYSKVQKYDVVIFP